jgi:hypothetical protein
MKHGKAAEFPMITVMFSVGRSKLGFIAIIELANNVEIKVTNNKMFRIFIFLLLIDY